MRTKKTKKPKRKLFPAAAAALARRDPDCLAFADAGSQRFLLLGEARRDGESRRFRIIREYRVASPGRPARHEREEVASFRSVWRVKAVRGFLGYLKEDRVGYSKLLYLKSDEF